MNVRSASFALRVVRRRAGHAAIVYRRSLDEAGRERLTRIASLGPLAFSAGTPLLRAAASSPLKHGPYLPLDADWGARVACYALLSAGLRDPDRLHRAAGHLACAHGTEAAWWLGQMARPGGHRATRALRILTEAVQ